MAKRECTEQMRKNLAKGKKIDAKIAREYQEKSVASRNRKTDLRELLEIALLLQNVETGEQNNIAMTNSLIERAIKGDVKAYEVIRDTIGQKPVERQEIIGGDLKIEVVNDKD